MSRFSDRLTELDTVSQNVAWKLVDTLFGQIKPAILSSAGGGHD